jgi:hypothetical protein
MTLFGKVVEGHRLCSGNFVLTVPDLLNNNSASPAD